MHACLEQQPDLAMPRKAREDTGASRSRASDAQDDLADDVSATARDENDNSVAVAEANSDSAEPDPASVLRILVASDVHLGYAEKDPIRGDDSFRTFEEILKLAVQQEADLLLLGGDLFHDNKPSRRCLHRCLQLLRQYCFSDRPVQFQVLSDQKRNFHQAFGRVNYEDPHFNVGLPVFSVHGNHDDPSGDGPLSAMDLLSVTNMLNYFGRAPDLDNIQVYPVLLQKGTTRLALYGLGHIRDERLARLFQRGKVQFMRPSEDTDDWFSLLTLHQNRVGHSANNFIRESMLDDFLDFIVWGHEHECRILPVKSAEADYHVCQPGSSVATSLSEGESVAKHVGLLELYGSDFRVIPLPLKSTRPFIYRDISLRDIPDLENADDAIVAALAKEVAAMIDLAHQDFPAAAGRPELPLVRLKVDHTGFTTISAQQFGQRFVGHVANPNDILKFYKRRNTARLTGGAGGKARDADDEAALALTAQAGAAGPSTTRIQNLINQYLHQHQDLKLLSEKELHEAVEQFVDKDERSAIADAVKSSLRKTQARLHSDTVSDAKGIEDAVVAHSVRVRAADPAAAANVLADMLPPSDDDGDAVAATGGMIGNTDLNDEDDDDDNDDDGEDDDAPSRKRRASVKITRRPSRRAAAAAPSRRSTVTAARRRRGTGDAEQSANDQASDNEGDDDSPSDMPARKRRRVTAATVVEPRSARATRPAGSCSGGRVAASTLDSFLVRSGQTGDSAAAVPSAAFSADEAADDVGSEAVAFGADPPAKSSARPASVSRWGRKRKR